jgi:hypothetical protein
VKEILSELGLGLADCAVSGIPFFWLSELDLRNLPPQRIYKAVK